MKTSEACPLYKNSENLNWVLNLTTKSYVLLVTVDGKCMFLKFSRGGIQFSGFQPLKIDL